MAYKTKVRDKFLLSGIFKFEGEFKNWNFCQKDQNCHVTKCLTIKSWGKICATLHTSNMKKEFINFNLGKQTVRPKVPCSKMPHKMKV